MIFIKRINKINQQQLQTDNVIIDQNLKFIAIYDCNKDCVYLTTSLIILHHFIEYKNKFEQDLKYKLVKSLPYIKKISNTKNSSILKILFTKVENKDILIISYFSGLVEIYQNKHSWQVKGTFNTQQHLTDIFCFQNNIYTINYSLNVRCYSILMLGREINITLDNVLNILFKKENQFYYQTKNSTLKNRDVQLIEGYKLRKSQILLQSQNSENLIKNFEIDFNKQYIIRNHPCQIYALQPNFIKIKTIESSPDFVSISPFQYKIGKILVLVYHKTLKFDKIAKKSKRVTFKTESPEQYLLQIINLKYNIVKILWIGPFQLLLVDQKQKLYFLEIFSEKFEL